jgi:hypothetical protein
MKAAQNLPLVAHPEQITTHWPSVATDHNLPLRHALTESVIGTGILTGFVIAGLITFEVRAFTAWLWAGFVTFIMFAVILLKRYEDHVAYVRDDRRPDVADVDLDLDGQPDRVHAVWYGNGAPAGRPGTLAATYSLSFAAFVATCQRVGTTGRALRAEGYDDELQALFRNWLLQYQGANLLRNGRWELAEEETLRRVLRCTGWQEES